MILDKYKDNTIFEQDFKTSVQILNSMIHDSQGYETDSFNNYVKSTQKWNSKLSNWRENFYPGANYSKDICPEVYNRLSKSGFYLKKSCAKQSAFTMGKLVTITFNFATYQNLSTVQDTLMMVKST